MDFGSYLTTLSSLREFIVAMETLFGNPSPFRDFHSSFGNFTEISQHIMIYFINISLMYYTTLKNSQVLLLFKIDHPKSNDLLHQYFPNLLHCRNKSQILHVNCRNQIAMKCFSINLQLPCFFKKVPHPIKIIFWKQNH